MQVLPPLFQCRQALPAIWCLDGTTVYVAREVNKCRVCDTDPPLDSLTPVLDMPVQACGMARARAFATCLPAGRSDYG